MHEYIHYCSRDLPWQRPKSNDGFTIPRGTFPGSIKSVRLSFCSRRQLGVIIPSHSGDRLRLVSTTAVVGGIVHIIHCEACVPPSHSAKVFTHARSSYRCGPRTVIDWLQRRPISSRSRTSRRFSLPIPFIQSYYFPLTRRWPFKVILEQVTKASERLNSLPPRGPTA